jgi:hypothetical protein
MTICALRILPPFAIARLGSAPEPVENYTIQKDRDGPLAFRRIVGATTLRVDDTTGEICDSYVPTTVAFRQGRRIRPVAPFFEVFAQIEGEEQLKPLTLELLEDHGLRVDAICWCVRVANRKVMRRTGDDNDLVEADTGWFWDHNVKLLEGHCNNFIARDRFITFGQVRYIRPNRAFPEIRLRFTPAHGWIYGANKMPKGPRIDIPPERSIYKARKKSWFGLHAPDPEDKEAPFFNETLPPALFANEALVPVWLNGNKAVSRGYLDDACDGFVEVRLKRHEGDCLHASARICAGPPMMVPDALSVRNLSDDLDQVIHGPDVPEYEEFAVTRERAEDIVRRAWETVRFLNVAVMNGNSVKGRDPLTLDTMPEGEAFDTQRAERPIFPGQNVDTLAVLALHQEVFAALRGGTAPWFLRHLRRPDEVADYTDRGRRKMPALMCGADNNYLALTYRQLDTIRVAAQGAAIRSAAVKTARLTPRNRSALHDQLHYEATGNPVSSRPDTAVANCVPGLEVDFRAVWRRLFQGIELREYDNLVVGVCPDQDDSGKLTLKGHRLLRVNTVPVVTTMKGPSPSDPEGSTVLSTKDNPDAVAPLEWSNALARVLFNHMGKMVRCDFSTAVAFDRQIADQEPYLTFCFVVRPFFEEGTAVISKALAEPGELTQGLCSPWQNDYRECSCYYWAAARPDFVNVRPSPTGSTIGDNWFQKTQTGDYVPDDYADSRLILYPELFTDWEKWLRIQIGGKDGE